MKLSDVMSAMNLSSYAEVALLIFLAAFALVAYEVVRHGRDLEAFSRLPLDKEPKHDGAPNKELP